MKLKEESEKVGLKLNIQKTKIMIFGPITSWEIDEETVETVSGFILGGSKITADGDCSHDIKRCLHWKKYTIKGETDHQPRLDAWDGSGMVHWEDPEGWDGERGGRGDWDGEHM